MMAFAPAGSGTVILHNVAPKFYAALVAAAADDVRARIAFDGETLEIVAPSADHERCARLVDRLMAVLALEYGVDIEFFGSTTFKTPAGGGEPDACFYIASAGAVLGKRALDLAIDPPPDIVCEIDLTRERIDKRGLYASFGVPEFWRFDGESMCAYALRRAEYVEVEHSVAFPWLAIAEVERFLKMRETSGQTEIIRAWRAWLLARR